jgi:hypothetical protein
MFFCKQSEKVFEKVINLSQEVHAVTLTAICIIVSCQKYDATSQSNRVPVGVITKFYNRTFFISKQLFGSESGAIATRCAHRLPPFTTWSLATTADALSRQRNS